MTISFAPSERALLELLAGGTSAPVGQVEAVVDLAVRWRVEARALAALEARATLPDALRRRLVAGSLECAARATWLRHAGTRLSLSLSAAGIDHRLVKGLALEEVVSAAERWMDDVDVLVHERDRARTVAFLRARGLELVPQRRHDGAMARAERDFGGALYTSSTGAPIDVHFTRRALPASAGGACPTLEESAVALSDHALVHHRGDLRFLARLVGDLRALIDCGHVEPLRRRAQTSDVLAEALGWLGQLGAPELRGRRVALRGFEGRARLRRALRAIGPSPWSRLLPARAYLEGHDPEARGRPWIELQGRRWARVVRGALA